MVSKAVKGNHPYLAPVVALWCPDWWKDWCRCCWWRHRWSRCLAHQEDNFHSAGTWDHFTKSLVFSRLRLVLPGLRGASEVHTTSRWSVSGNINCCYGSHFIIIITNPLTARVVGAPQMVLQQVFSIFPCSPLPSKTCRTPDLPIPLCCLPTSSSVCLVFFPLSPCLARWFWPDLMNGKYDHTTAVYVSLRSSGGFRVVQLPAGSWHRLPRW